MIRTMAAALLCAMALQGCGTYAGEGAMVGGVLGSEIGSSIGSFSGSYRNEAKGSLFGLAAGAMIGAAVGAASDTREKSEIEAIKRRRQAQREDDYNQYGYGDDRIVFEDERPNEPRSISVDDLANAIHNVEIRSIRCESDSGDNVLRAGQQAKVTVDIINKSNHAIHDVAPLVEIVSPKKKATVSGSINIERIPSHRGVRFSATLTAKKSLKDGEMNLKVSVIENRTGRNLASKPLTIPTRKK